MTAGTHQRVERRSDALTKARIVNAAIVLLNQGGTEALSFRALAAALSTGAGAIYHHVANKGELLATAATAAMTDVLADAGDPDPVRALRSVTTKVFDAITIHPWLGTQLVAAPWQPAVLQLFDRLGSEVTALGVPSGSQFDAASVLVHHVLGVASQYDATSQLTGPTVARPTFLRSKTAPLLDDPTDPYPFLSRIGDELVQHDDRAQFLAGIEIILTGVQALCEGSATGRPDDGTAGRR